MNFSQLLLVAKREFITRARGKGFLFVSALMLIAAIGAPIATSYIPAFTESAAEITIAVDDAPEGFQEMVRSVAGGVFEVEFVEAGLSGDTLDTALLEREITADVVIEDASSTPTFVWRLRKNAEIESLIGVSYTRLAIGERAQELNLSEQNVGELLEPVDYNNRIADPMARSRVESVKEEIRSGVATIGLFTAFLIPQIFGQFTMLSIIEEKSSRVIEVVLSQVRTTTLLAGKIVGLSALGLVQVSLIFVAFVGSLLTFKSIEVPASVWRFVPIYAICLIFGLFMYVTLFALIGSMISRQEDASQVIMPVLLPLMLGYFTGQFAVHGDADHPFVQLTTWIPLTSPMLLPVRVAKDAITSIELVGALFIQFITTATLMWLAARVFEFTLLRTGSRVTWRELFSRVTKRS